MAEGPQMHLMPIEQQSGLAAVWHGQDDRDAQLLEVHQRLAAVLPAGGMDVHMHLGASSVPFVDAGGDGQGFQSGGQSEQYDDLGWVPAQQRTSNVDDDPFLRTHMLDPPRAEVQTDLRLPIQRTHSAGTLPPPDEGREPDRMQSLEWIPSRPAPGSDMPPSYMQPDHREQVFTPGGSNFDDRLLPNPGKNPVQESQSSAPPRRASASFAWIKEDWSLEDAYHNDAGEISNGRQFHHESIPGQPIPALPVAKEDKRDDNCSLM